MAEQRNANRMAQTGSLPTGFIGTFGVNLRPNTDGLSVSGTSAAANAGVALSSAYSGSINSVVRPQGGGWDIGAYEFGSSQTSTPPAPPTNVRIVR